MSQEIKTNRLSIYLIKDEYADHASILKNHSSLETKTIEGIG